MSLEAIEKEILKKASEEANVIHSQALEERKIAIEQAKERAKSIENAAKESAEATAKGMIEEAKSEAYMNRFHVLLEANKELIDGNMNGIRSEVKKLLAGKYGAQLSKKLKKRVDTAFENETNVEVETNKQMAQMFNEKKYKVSITSFNGVMARSTDGKVTVNGSIDDILESSVAQIRKEIGLVIKPMFDAYKDEEKGERGKFRLAKNIRKKHAVRSAKKGKSSDKGKRRR